MSITPSSLLLDSNIWIDLFLPERLGHHCALQLVSTAIEQDVTLFAAANSIKDVYFILGADGKRSLRAEGIAVTPERAVAINEYAWGCIKTIEDCATMVPLDQSDLWIATKLRPVHDDFEDNLVLAAMERSKANYLITCDEKLLERAPVAALTAEAVLRLMQ